MTATSERAPVLAPTATAEKPALRWLSIDAVTPYEHNPRRAPASAIELVARSIAENGFLSPIICDTQQVILAGHTRLLAARSLGLAQVPVIIAPDLSPAQAKAYRLMDNRSHEESCWNQGLLSAELAELIGMEIDPALTGFSAEELSALLAPPLEGTLGLCDPDALIEPPKKPVTRPGDVWLCGRHRLGCGDATKAADVSRLMAGERAVLMATDWPYGVGYDGGNHPQTWGNGGKQAGRDVATKHWDDYREPGSLSELYVSSLRNALECALTPRAAIYTFFAMMRAPLVFEAWRQAGLLPHQVIIWHKSRAVLGRSDYAYDYEPCLYGWRAGRRPQPERRPAAGAPTIWAIPSAIEDGAAGLHPTQKPVALIRRPIEFHTRPGELLYEPFAGSGTALIAAEASGRRCYALEISPAFCDAARLRWERFTGKRAILEAQP
jgi:DNA modification methylase